MIARYTRPEMGRIWSEENKFRQWLAVELAATETLAAAGEMPSELRDPAFDPVRPADGVLSIDVLGGASARSTPLLHDSAAYIAALLAEAEGICQGLIAEEPRGSNGFGYDPVFYFPELSKTYAELTESEKNQVSHRARAVRALLSKLREM